MKIPITKPLFDDCEKESIVKPLETGWVVQGPFVREFEQLFASFTGAAYAAAVSNCTTALHLGLEALGIGRGDAVIVPSFTYVASQNSVETTGAEVVFADIDLKTFNIDTRHVERLLEADKSKKIKAVMPVNLFGLMADLPRIMEIAAHYGIKVIEDSACGFDARIDGKHSGTFGDCGCFSFHPRKAITTGEGGMVITNNESLAENVSRLRDHGAGKSDFSRHGEKGGSLLPEFDVRGFNYRMTDFQGAVGVCQMKKAPANLEQRRCWAKRYDEALKGNRMLLAPSVPENYTHGYQSYVCLFTDGKDISNLTIDTIDALNIKRNEWMFRLEDKGIATRQGTHAVHTLGYYRNKYGLTPKDHIYSYAADRLSITLPLYATMTEEEFEYVINAFGDQDPF
jgi:perosamine synthetase